MRAHRCGGRLNGRYTNRRCVNTFLLPLVWCLKTLRWRFATFFGAFAFYSTHTRLNNGYR